MHSARLSPRPLRSTLSYFQGATSYNRSVPVSILQGPIRAVLFLLAAGAATAQTSVPAAPAALPKTHKQKRVRPPQPPYNPNQIVLDPGHGGSDAGADLGRAGQEKDFNQAFAERLKGLLEAQQFTVVLTHASADDNPPPDQRAEMANRSHAVACLLLHATLAGHGVHLFTSSLTAPFFSGDPAADTAITPWDSAQAVALPRSLELANELSTALNGLRVPLVVARVSLRPIDSLACPAVAVEIAPAGADKFVADETYEQHVAQSLVTALSFWRERAKAQIAAQRAAFDAANPAPTPTTAPRPKLKPKPLAPPAVPPSAPGSTPHRPAPIERRPPPPAVNVPEGAAR